MKVIGTEYAVSHLDRKHPPVVTIDPPEILMVKTLDARWNKLKKKEDLYRTRADNPATGPIKVNGAKPGDAVRVRIENILLDKQGYTLLEPERGIVGDMVSEYVVEIVSVRQGYICFTDDIWLKVEPMVGVVGTAPRDITPSTLSVGYWGGNMDNKRITTGAEVFLPVFVDGALVYIGDVHARMGDAEATGTAIEIGSTVTVTVDVVKNANINYPYIETDDLIITTGSAREFYEAAKIAVKEMINKLAKIKKISLEQAYMLISAVADVRLNQACRSPDIDMSVRVEFPRKEL